MRIVLAFIAGSMLLCAADAGKDWGVEKRSWTDPVTGVRVWEMTANKGDASNLYFHFPNLTRDGKYVLFTSNRSGSNQIFRMTLPEGRILQLTDAAAIGGLVPDPTAAHRIYYMRGSEVVVLDVESLAERVVGRVEGASAPTISGDGKWLALQRGTEIGRLNTDTGEYKPVTRVGFRI